MLQFDLPLGIGVVIPPYCPVGRSHRRQVTRSGALPARPVRAGGVVVGKTACRAVDRDDAAPAVGVGAVVKRQGASMIVGDLEDLVFVVAHAVLDAQGLVVGGFDAEQVAVGFEGKPAAVVPVPDQDGDAIGKLDRVHGGLVVLQAADFEYAVAGVAGGAQAGVGRVAGEDDAAAVGLNDLDDCGVHAQLGLVAEPPLPADVATGFAFAVVMPDDFQAEAAGQRGQVGLLLVFVAGDDVDGIAGAGGLAAGGRAAGYAGGGADVAG